MLVIRPHAGVSVNAIPWRACIVSTRTKTQDIFGYGCAAGKLKTDPYIYPIIYMYLLVTE